MKLAALSLVLVAAAACGGKSKPPATGNTGGTPANQGSVPAQWAEVLVEGATFTLDNSSGGVPSDEPVTVIVKVTKVTRDGYDGSAALTWNSPAGEEVSSGLPTEIHVHRDQVSFGSGEDAVRFPTPSADAPQVGYYAHVDGDTVCYGEGPGPDAGDCEDVCYAELCVAAGRGIVSGSGTWWPNYEMFEQVAQPPK